MKDLRTKKDSELVLRAKQLQKEAGRILNDLGLMGMLKEISEPEIIGSVQNGLMVARDIDIHAYVKEYDLQKIVNLLPRLALLPTIQKVQFNNYRELRRDYRKDRDSFPHAYYVGLRTVPACNALPSNAGRQPSGEWKIDIWFLRKDDDDVQFGDSKLLDLSDEQKETILKLKKAWLENGVYRDDATSIDFYKAVLDFGVKNEKDFERYLKLQNPGE